MVRALHRIARAAWFVLVAAAFGAIPTALHAEDPTTLPGGGVGGNPFYEGQTLLGRIRGRANVGDMPLEVILGNLVKAAISLVGVVFFAFMVWAGYLWMTAQGETDRVEKAKRMITQGVIGMAITLASYAIASFVVSKLLETGAVKQ